MKQLIVIAHNLRSAHNVGSILRTADGLGVKHVYLTGYTPHPKIENDKRLPHEIIKTEKALHKTALGAENNPNISYEENLPSLLDLLKSNGYMIAALEQTADSMNLSDFISSNKIAIILGREVEGIEENILKLADIAIEIPMHGKKESYNVTQAMAIATYTLINKD